jgi:hypothetical protein
LCQATQPKGKVNSLAPKNQEVTNMNKFLVRWGFISLAVILALASYSTLTRAERDGQGEKFKAFGAVSIAQDPENSTNEVLAFDATTSTPAGVIRKLHKGTKVAELDNQVQLKYYFVGRTCTLGTPRIQLAIDTDGDGKPDGNAFGYLGDKAFGGGCVPGQWVFEDMTDNAPKWDLSQFGGGMTNTWDQMEAFFAAFPNHQVITGSLVDDPYGLGRVYFDNVVIGNRSIDNHEDVDGAKK